MSPSGNKRRGERRKYERKNLIFYLRVHDDKKGSLLGHVVNFSANGLMMLSGSAISLDSRQRLRLKLPAVTCSHEDLIFDAHSRWCHKDKNPDFYITGFQLCFAKKQEKTESEMFLERLSGFERHCRDRRSLWNYSNI
ncbi:MAG: PilZ domain-containing protein [Desulfocapsaceae bacterium]|nr:PilZ domain-containing protein [Desulfocapsaceae bacterium]